MKGLWNYFMGAKPVESQRNESGFEAGPSDAARRGGGGFKRSVPAPNQPGTKPLSKSNSTAVMQELDKGSSGGVQGFAWFSLRQRKDEDGVIADAFFVESPSGLLMPKQVRLRPKPKQVEIIMVESGNIVLSG